MASVVVTNYKIKESLSMIKLEDNCATLLNKVAHFNY